MSNNLLELADDSQAGRSVITVTEPIDVGNANAMRMTGENLIAESPHAALCIDVERVAANSVALAVLLRWLASARQHARQVQFRGMSGGLSAVVEFSGASRLLVEETGEAH